MTALNTGGFGALQIKDQSPDGTYLNRRHSPGIWKTLMVSPVEYKMRAIAIATGLPEFWIASNPQAGPPSGVAVTNKAIMSVVTNGFPTNA